MRKYQQLLLLLFSFTSLILVLVYRHEYNRLHYVLEVFNFFGTPCNFSELRTSDKRLDHFDWGQNPVWQQNGEYQIFSAFSNNSYAQVIAVVKKVSKMPKKCILWHEDENPTTASISSLKIADSDGLEAYIFSCGFKYHKIPPYAVSIGFSSKYFTPQKIILTHIEKSDFVKATVCVPPSTYNKRELVEFLSFHSLIGFKYFILYYDDIPYSLLKFLSNLSKILEIDFTFYPWNFPFNSSGLIRSIIEKDCLLRTFGKSESSIVLAFNEYLIPLDSYGIYPLFQKGNHSFESINIPVQAMCIKTNETFYPIAVQNTNSYDDGEMRVVKFHFNSNVKSTKTNDKNSDQMVVHSYKYCKGYTGPFKSERSMSMYSTDFSRSLLVRLLTHNEI